MRKHRRAASVSWPVITNSELTMLRGALLPGGLRLPLAVVLATMLLASNLFSQQPVPAATKPADTTIREIYVPFEDLNVILDNDKHRVFLTREEYEELIEQARSKPQTPAPHKVILLAAEYEGQ